MSGGARGGMWGPGASAGGGVDEVWGVSGEEFTGGKELDEASSVAGEEFEVGWLRASSPSSSEAGVILGSYSASVRCCCHLIHWTAIEI